ncbi:MAG: hypothetical protein RLZ39_1749, partial [Bacteroidota bacterium]
MPNLLMHKIGKVSFLLAFVLMMMGGESVMGQIYQEDFGNNQTVVLPYSSGTNATGSVIKNINITTPSWNQNLTSANLAGNTLGAMSATTGTSSYTITCTFSVNSGFQLIPTSIGFDNRGSSTGPSALTVTITGTGGSTTVSLSPSKTGAFTTTTATNFLNTNLNLTGNITLTFAFSGGSSGSTERFDNMILNGTVSAISSGALTSPTLSAASTPSVDAPFNVSFTDDASWRAAITSITVGGTTLSASAYTISAGQITFTPSASSLLQTPGTKSIVVISTGYNNATVSQVIVAGVPANLTMSTQPSAPATSGAVLATMPAVLVKDQYS